ncbi:LysM peptidoglycan-binding domain-containing protein [Streptomyces sp. SGAir0957]
MKTRSKSAAFARGLLSLAALTILLAAVPYALLRIGVLPHHVPSGGEITAALTEQDTGQLFLGAITLIGWYGYVSFAFSVVLEAASIARHRKAPRMRMLSGTQRLAGILVGGIFLLLPTSGAFAAPAVAAPQTAATATVTPAASTPAPSTAEHQSASQNTHTGPVHHVKAGDTLWDIAEQRLGDGLRWREIVEANQGISMPGGQHLTEDTTDLQPGWTLRLPSDAKAAASEGEGVHTQTEGRAAHDPEHTVKPGETLSSIAEDELGDADDYPAIAKANDNVRQPDGRTLTDPDEIYPGWQLKIPAAQEAPDDAANTPAPEHDSDSKQDQAPEHDRGGEQQDEGKEHDQGGGQATERPGTPATQAPAPHESAKPDVSAPAPDAPDASAEPAPQHDTGTDSSSVRTVAAAGSILAAAVLAVLATRRARQQRRRRAKRRIPMPSGAVADFEKQLRATSDITGTALADRALRTMAAHCREAGRPLPEVEAMRIAARGVELHLSAATAPVAPFTEREGNPMVWWCPARGAALLDAEEAADVTPPYPALVSLGETEGGDAVLVDLESVGLLRLAGHPADVRAVMLALAVELASSKLAPATQIVLAGAGSDLHHLYPDQIDHHADLNGAAAELKAHDTFQRDALADGGHDHLRAARLSEETGGDTWIPRILLSTDPVTGPSAAALEDLITSRPRTSVAVVTAAGADLDLHGAWTLPTQPGTAVELPGLDLAVKLQYLDDAAYDRLVQLLATSSRTDDVPPPAWTGHSADNGPRSAVDPTGETSALAPDTAWIPQPAPHMPAQSSDLSTALPSFDSLAPAYTSAPAPTPHQDSSPVEAGDSALSPAVAGAAPAADDVFVTHAENGTLDSTAHGAAADEQEPDADEESPALATGVWDVEEPAEALDREEPAANGGEEEPAGDFDSVLGEVLAEQDAPTPGDDGENAASALSAAALGANEQEQVVREARIIPRPSAATSTVLAALSTPPASPDAPQVQVLGPVALTGARGRVGSNRRNSLMEIAAYLVLHPGLGRQDLDDAIWPGMRINAETRNTAISRLRSWMGQDPHLAASDPQAAYLPPIKGGIYRFNTPVTSDWDKFRELYQQGMHHDGQDADIALAQALTLVRGRPFADVDPSKYTWAEADIQEMISAIVDVAHELAERRRQVRDYRAAAQAVTKGMLVDSQSELLYRDLFTICHEMGDREGLERAAHQLARINAEEGIDSSPETVGLLRTLLKGERGQVTWGSAAS